MIFTHISDGKYRLDNIVTRMGIEVAGGNQSLFRYFISKYEAETIEAYIDLSKSFGIEYEELGFRKEELLEPNFVWYNPSKKESIDRRTAFENFVKHGECTDERDIGQIGYIRVYDCGKLRAIWRK
jgi:hypothetical protein